VLLNCLGNNDEAHCQTDTPELDILPGDVFILCSDGLSNQVGDAFMYSVVKTLHEDPYLIAQALVGAALKAGGKDNITVVVVHCQ
jgi:protein phosphatase